MMDGSRHVKWHKLPLEFWGHEYDRNWQALSALWLIIDNLPELNG